MGGQFATRVWDGHHFVYVYHVAMFDAANSAWLPLTNGGELRCSDASTASVNALVWEASTATLYIAGNFDLVESHKITSGLAVWSPSSGLRSFPGGGVGNEVGDTMHCEVQSLVFDTHSKSLFVGGTFWYVNGMYCVGIAVWNR